MEDLKQIPQDGSTFMANGRNYRVHKDISIDRWIKMQALQIELGFGVEYQEMQSNWLKVVDFANKQKFVDIAVMAHNMTNGVGKLFSREPMILKFCALYINAEGEDTGIITDEMVTEKINDWKAEGFGMEGFFAFSLSKVSGLADNFKSIILEGSDHSEEK